MTVRDYLSEDGRSAFADWFVGDLVAETTAEIELVFVFESPHVDELARGYPVAGASGRAALRFLLSDPASDGALGRMVKHRLAEGDGRVAIMNVSNVPMQAAAFVGTEAPALASADWSVLERVRTSSARSVETMRTVDVKAETTFLIGRLQSRVEALSLSERCSVVTAGVFAQRMVAGLPEGLVERVLRVPHPSYNQWNRPAYQARTDLMEVRHRFAEASSGT